MPRLTYEGSDFQLRAAETVLEALQRHGIEVPSSCRAGICCICLLRRTDSPPPAEVQVGLRPGLRERGYFLACRYTPENDLEVAPPRDADLFSNVTVRAKELLSQQICRVTLEPATPLYYHAGQFINLRRSDGQTRSYSLSSVPTLDRYLEIHVRRIPDGVMSNWIFDELQIDDQLEFQGPSGRCYYFPGQPARPMLLLSTGTGLSPLLGIVRDALHSGHSGPIHLYHGSGSVEGHYAREVLHELGRCHPNFHYVPCYSSDHVVEGLVPGRAEEVAFAEHTDLSGWQVYLCGKPRMVYGSRERAIKAGVGPLEIHADPHDSGPRPEGRKRSYPDPDPELWSALDEGLLLTRILTDFYNKVYEDPRLSKFFDGIGKQRAIEKQYSFLYKVFTGEDIYFGESPHTAHHWMVISDELFDYREELMAASMRKYDFPERLIRRWRALHERYREDIIKSEPFPKVIDGVALPLDGFGVLDLDLGGVCDICDEEIPRGGSARYHKRLGTVYCHHCMA